MKQLAGIDAKWWIGGGLAAGAIVWWAVRNRNKAAPATNTADPNIDPNTGLPYGSDGGYSPVQGVTPSLYGYYDQFGNLISPGSNNTTVTAPTTNAAWAQQAAAYLVSQYGYDGPTVTAAIGKAFAGLNLSDNEYAIVQTAAGFEGQPPQGWPNGAPHVAPPAGQPKQGGLIAIRKDSNTGSITYKATESSWNAVAQDKYNFVNTQDVGFVGSTLAHYNAKSGLSNPKGTVVLLPKNLYAL